MPQPLNFLGVYNNFGNCVESSVFNLLRAPTGISGYILMRAGTISWPPENSEAPLERAIDTKRSPVFPKPFALLVVCAVRLLKKLDHLDLQKLAPSCGV